MIKAPGEASKTLSRAKNFKHMMPKITGINLQFHGFYVKSAENVRIIHDVHIHKSSSHVCLFFELQGHRSQEKVYGFSDTSSTGNETGLKQNFFDITISENTYVCISGMPRKKALKYGTTVHLDFTILLRNRHRCHLVALQDELSRCQNKSNCFFALLTKIFPTKHVFLLKHISAIRSRFNCVVKERMIEKLFYCLLRF